ncbi:MAG: DUF4056 domain-containing protein [Candidatus Nanoarchaeia archaeon]
MKNLVSMFSLSLFVISMFFLSGCGRGLEWGHTPTGNWDPNPHNLAAYNDSRWVAGNGMILTKRNGHIDPDHMNKEIRTTGYIFDKAFAALMNNQTTFSNGYLDFELTYPKDWVNIPKDQKQTLAKKVALKIAKYGGYADGTWYEIVSWYGYNSTYIFSDFQSAFSWEDLYSDYAGVLVAINAIESVGNGRGSAFSSKVTKLKQEFVNKSEPVSASEAERVTKSVKGSWSSQGFGVARTYTILRRNMDFGYGDGVINPSLIPGFACGTPDLLAVPKITDVESDGFKLKVTVNGPWQLSTVKSRIGLAGKFEPAKHFEKIMPVIKKEAISKGFSVDY